MAAHSPRLEPEFEGAHFAGEDSERPSPVSDVYRALEEEFNDEIEAQVAENNESKI